MSRKSAPPTVSAGMTTEMSIDLPHRDGRLYEVAPPRLTSQVGKDRQIHFVATSIRAGSSIASGRSSQFTVGE